MNLIPLVVTVAVIFLGSIFVDFEVGGGQIAGGESRLSAQENLPRLKRILWLLLVGAVITTGKMALNLFRDMRAS